MKKNFDSGKCVGVNVAMVDWTGVLTPGSGQFHLSSSSVSETMFRGNRTSLCLFSLKCEELDNVLRQSYLYDAP